MKLSWCCVSVRMTVLLRTQRPPPGLQQRKRRSLATAPYGLEPDLQPHSVCFVDFPSITVVHFVPSSDVSHLYVYEVGEAVTIV